MTQISQKDFRQKNLKATESNWKRPAKSLVAFSHDWVMTEKCQGTIRMEKSHQLFLVATIRMRLLWCWLADPIFTSCSTDQSCFKPVNNQIKLNSPDFSYRILKQKVVKMDKIGTKISKNLDHYLGSKSPSWLIWAHEVTQRDLVVLYCN